MNISEYYTPEVEDGLQALLDEIRGREEMDRADILAEMDSDEPDQYEDEDGE